MKVFVSYPNNENSTIRQIFDHLPKDTVVPWIDDHKIPFGSSIEEKVEAGIKDAEYFISFLNEEATKSEWVEKELELAFKREEALGRSFVLPILMDRFPPESLDGRFQKGSRRFLVYQGGGYVRSIAAFANELTDELFRLVCERPTLDCEGIAVVYYLSFIKPLFEKMLIATKLEMKWSNQERQSIDPFQVRLRVVLPALLEESKLDKIRTRLQLEEGELYDGASRLFGVSFSASQNRASSQIVTLFDVPKILSSAAKLKAYSRHDDRQRTRPEWMERAKQEMRAFKNRLEHLITNMPDDDVESRIEVSWDQG
jgi:hypothetical protein